MKLEKDDRIISNADYEKLVGLAELHERAIKEVLEEILTEELIIIHRHIGKAQESLLLQCEMLKNKTSIIKSQDSVIEYKDEIIQRKNAEIARLQKKYWWKIF